MRGPGTVAQAGARPVVMGVGVSGPGAAAVGQQRDSAHRCARGPGGRRTVAQQEQAGPRADERSPTSQPTRLGQGDSGIFVKRPLSFPEIN